VRLIVSLSLSLLSYSAFADLPAPPEVAELGACQPQQQKLATDSDCVSCEKMGSGNPCEQEWKPKGYEQRCRVEIRGYNNEVWCKGNASAKQPAPAKAKSCSVDHSEDSSTAVAFGLFALLVTRRRKRA
jgi:hypothetical protein